METVVGSGGALESGSSGGAGTGGGQEMTRGPWTYIKASNSGTADFFGAAVAVSADSNTLVVGAPGESGAGDGVQADPADNSAINAGAGYVFVKVGDHWREETYLKAPNSDSGDSFGHAMALSADGNTWAIGAPYEASAAQGIDGDQTDNSASDAGAVYVFSRTGGQWAFEAYLKAEYGDDSDFFGISLSLSADGNVLAVGAEGDDSGAVGVNPDPKDKSAPESGAVYLYARSDSSWTHSAYLKASNTDILDHFGGAVALSAAGTTLAVGAYWESAAADDPADNSADSAGAVYIFRHEGGSWTQSDYVKPSSAEFGAGDDFGSAVSLSGDGTALAVGAAGDDDYAGSAYLFSSQGGKFEQNARLVAYAHVAGDEFGDALQLSPDGTRLAVGAALASGQKDDDESLPEAGAVYLFDIDLDLSWYLSLAVQAPHADAGDRLGRSLAWTNEGTLIIGATRESSAAQGVDGDWTDNTRSQSGAVYFLPEIIR